MSLPYKTKPWETVQYQRYVEQARAFKISGHHKEQMEMVAKAEFLMKELISAYDARQEKMKDALDDAAKKLIDDGKIPVESADYFEIAVDKAKETAVTAATSPVLIAAGAGVLLYLFVIKRKR